MSTYCLKQSLFHQQKGSTDLAGQISQRTNKKDHCCNDRRKAQTNNIFTVKTAWLKKKIDEVSLYITKKRSHQ